MNPTSRLRFIERDCYSKNGEFFTHPFKVRILQQWWCAHRSELGHDFELVGGEWRDIPLEEVK